MAVFLFLVTLELMTVLFTTDVTDKRDFQVKCKFTDAVFSNMGRLPPPIPLLHTKHITMLG